MRSTTPFDLVLVPFPFASLAQSKKRPCLVLAAFSPKRLPRHYVVCMVTSQLDGVSFPYDHVLLDHVAAGLPKPSLVRLSKIVTLEESLVEKRLGSLAVKDQTAIRKGMRALFEL